MAYIYSLADTWADGATTFTAIKMSVTDTASAAASLLMDLQVSGASRFSVTKAGGATFAGAVSVSGANNSLSFPTSGSTSAGTGPNIANYFGTLGLFSGSTLGARYQFGVGGGWILPSSQAYSIEGDVNLYRDAANTLAQRNGVNAQAFNLYNTYTDASNYERGFMRFVSNVLEIGTQAAGTGTNRLIRFLSAAPSAAWEFKSTATATPTLVLAGSDRSVTLYPQVNMLVAANGGFWSALDYAAGAANQFALRQSNANASTYFFGLIGSAAGVMQLNNGSGRGAGYGATVEMWETTAPAAPATDGVRIYAEDDGAGKTRLMARFATGAAVQIAIEP